MATHKLAGIIKGFEIWMTYAVMEYVFSTAAPAVLHHDKVLDLGTWRGTVMLLAAYQVFGAITGLADTLLIRSGLSHQQFERTSQQHLTALVVILYAINLTTLPSTPQRSLALLAAAVLCGATILGFGAAGTRLSDSPAAVVFALLLSGRLVLVTWHNVAIWLAAPMMLFALAASTSLCLFLARLSVRIRRSTVWTPVLRHSISAALVVALIFGPSLVTFAGAHETLPLRERTGKASSPNIVLITMDTVRADHLGVYGYSRDNTPCLQQLAAESYLYTKFISVSPITLTSHASIFTGYYPRSHGAYKQIPEFPMGHPLPDSIPTVASILSRDGYRTIGIGANHWYLGPEWGLLRGFDYSSVPVPVPLVEDNSYFIKHLARELFARTAVASDFYSAPAVDAQYITSRATSILERVKRKGPPFFLFLNYMDAHWPYHSPPPFNREYPGRSDLFSGADDEAAFRTRIFLSKNRRQVPAVYISHMSSQYDGAIKFLDSEIGRLVRYLKAADLYDNTMIIVTSDHGEALGEWNEVGHNLSVHYDQINIPLMIKYPKPLGRAVISGVASQVDLLPTILEVAGIPVRRDLPGTSLLHLDAARRRFVFSECHYGPIRTPTPLSPVVQYAVTDGSYKMIKTSSGEVRLFDIATDPTEQHEIRDEAQLAELNAALTGWIRSTPPPQGPRPPLQPDQLRRLRSLGYLQ